MRRTFQARGERTTGALRPVRVWQSLTRRLSLVHSRRYQLEGFRISSCRPGEGPISIGLQNVLHCEKWANASILMQDTFALRQPWETNVIYPRDRHSIMSRPLCFFVAERTIRVIETERESPTISAHARRSAVDADGPRADQDARRDSQPHNRSSASDAQRGAGHIPRALSQFPDGGVRVANRSGRELGCTQSVLLAARTQESLGYGVVLGALVLLREDIASVCGIRCRDGYRYRGNQSECHRVRGPVGSRQPCSHRV